MSSAEFSLWLAEFKRRPWGDDVEDMRSGEIAAAVLNAHAAAGCGKVSKRRDGGDWTAADFVFGQSNKPRQQTPEHHQKLFAVLAKLGG